MEPVISIRNLNVSYNRVPALRNVNVDIEPGNVIGIVGPNGAGKSTLLKAIMSLLPVDSGEVRVLGQPITQQRKQIAYVPQRSAVDWDYPVVVEDVVLMGRYPHLGWLRRPGTEDRALAATALERVEMLSYSKRQIGQLSGGQQQRVFLARALAQRAQIYLLDEPFVGVDAATERTIYALIAELRDEGRTVMVVNHDLSTVQQHYDRLMLINGRLVAYGPTSEVFTPELLSRTYGGRLTLLEEAGQMMVLG